MKVLYALLVLVPIVLVLEFAGVENHGLMFVLSALALVPLAAVLGSATERVAEFTGQKIGGLLNATLGNAAELIITIVALREGLINVVKASIAGSIIGNILVVLGAAIVAGGIRNGPQQFDARIASTNAAAIACSSASTKCVPGVRFNPSAPTFVETTGKPLASDSRILRREPPPMRSGTVITPA